MIHGLRLSFHTEPTLSLEPDPSIVTGFSQSQKILPFIPDWIRNGYVREIFNPTPLFFSRMFTVPKKNGRLRPVIDLSVLNKLLIVPKFRMESVARITKAITSPKWGTTTDLEDAYFKVPVEEESQIYLAFTLFDQSLGFYRIFVFQVMPFGLSSAPWTFTRVLKPIKIHLHLRDMTVFSYLDDFLNLAESPLQVKSQTNFLVSLLNSLGFAVNLRKSSHVPSQSLEYLGVTWNLQDLSLSLPEAKVQKVLNLHRSTLNTPVLSRRDLERIVGYLNFTAPFRPLGRLYLLPIIQWMNSHSTVHNRDSPLPLDSSLRRILDPWSNQKALSSPVPMHIPNPSEELMTDASLFGWSGVLLPHRVEGGWHRSLWFHSMNWKELQAILLSDPLSPSPEGQGSQGLVGQHDGSSLHSPSGFGSLPCSSGAGFLPSDSLSSSQRHPDSIPHSRSSQCPSGRRFQEGPHRDGVVSGSPLLQRGLPSLGSPTTGPVRHPLQHPAMDLCLPVPGPSSALHERNGLGLEHLAVSIPLSPSADASTGSFKVRRFLGDRVRDSAFLALPGLVRHVGTQSSLLHSPASPTLPVPIYNSGTRVLPQRFHLEPSRMEAITKPLKLQGWSNNSLRCAQAEHKDTTQGSYQRIWSRFLTFLDNQGIPHREVVSSTVFNFISHEGLVHRKAWRTCTTYKAALFHPLRYSLGLDIGWEGSLPETNTLLKGLHRLNPPPPSKMPLWELSDLLYYLKSPVFEPLEHCSFTKCIQKTLALLILATARRISEISALSRLHSEGSSKIVLLWLSSFTPKHFTPTFHPEHPSIHALDPDIEDRSLCPVRAWKIYKERRRIFTIKALSHRFWILSRGDLSKQFRLLVRDSRQFVGKDLSVPMGPHQMRKLACSYSKKFWPRASSTLFTATGSKSMNVLSRCYIRDVPPLRYPCVLPLGTARLE